MWSIGFGFEKIGQMAHRFPKACALLLAVATLAAALQITKVKFDGDVTAVLPAESQAYMDFFDNKERFRDFSRDVTVLVESPRLMSASGLEDLRFLQLEIAVSQGVENVTSLFSVPLPDRQSGELGQFFPQEFTSDEEARARVKQLLALYPQAQSIISPSKNLAVLRVTLTAEQGDDAMDATPQFAAARKAALDAAPKDFKLRFTGLTPIGSTIVEALVSDQLRLTATGLALGAGIAFVVFRSFAAALLCAVPPALTAVWTLGLFGYFGTPINYLTTILPTLALIVSFADGIMLYFRWQHNSSVSDDADANMAEALVSVGPACSLTSITTALAFLSFLMASGQALHDFAILGTLAIVLAYLAVMVSLPVMSHFAVTTGMVKAGEMPTPRFGSLGSAVHDLVEPRPMVFALGSVVLVIVLGIVHFQIRPEYRITDYLPVSSDVREAETISNSVFGGRSMLLVSMPKAEAASVFSAANRDRLERTEAAISGIFPADRVSSANRLTAGMTSQAALDRLSAQIEGENTQGAGSYLSRDGATMLATIRIPSDQSINQTLNEIRQLKQSLAQLPWADKTIVTGFDVLMAEEFTGLIGQLRSSLVLAIFLGMVIVGMATRSPVLAVASITPNLLPILVVELVIWMRGGGVNMSEVIALTIAFGIAIDNAVHIINVHQAAKREGLPTSETVRRSMVEAGPALVASVVIICVSTLVTQLSVLPMVPVLGMLIIATLFAALAANLVILPANILVLERLFGSSKLVAVPGNQERIP